MATVILNNSKFWVFPLSGTKYEGIFDCFGNGGVGDAEFCLNGTRFEGIFDCFGKIFGWFLLNKVV